MGTGRDCSIKEIVPEIVVSAARVGIVLLS